MSEPLKLANQHDFTLGRITVSPSACCVVFGGEEARVEALTMRVLVVLARADAATVTRDDLVAACWEGRVVSDDAIARAIAKVRAIGRRTTPEAFTLITVPKVGYRLLASEAKAPDTASAPTPSASRHVSWRPRVLAAAGIAAVLLVGFVGVAETLSMHPARAQASTLPPQIHAAEVMDALMNLDEPRLGLYVQQGWNPNWHIDNESNAALHNLMMVCERNPGHDRMELVRVAQLLVKAGEDPAAHNAWGDTPLSIASAHRYCGPNHPVVAYLRSASAAWQHTHPGATAQPARSHQTAQQMAFARSRQGRW